MASTSSMTGTSISSKLANLAGGGGEGIHPARNRQISATLQSVNAMVNEPYLPLELKPVIIDS